MRRLVKWIKTRCFGTQAVDLLTEAQRHASQAKLEAADRAIALMNDLQVERRIVDQGVPAFDRRAHPAG